MVLLYEMFADANNSTNYCLLSVASLGFFVDLNLFKSNKGRAAEFLSETNSGSGKIGEPEKNDLADEDANLMIKLKFLTYKV